MKRTTRSLSPWPTVCMLLAALTLFVAAAACGRTLLRTKVPKQQAAKEPRRPPFEVLYVKATLRYSDPKTSLQALLHLRIRQDSIVWGSLALPIGVEAFRFLADDERIRLIDRIGNNYHSDNYDSLNKQWRLPQISYAWLERLLLARPLLDAQAYQQVTPPVAPPPPTEASSSEDLLHLHADRPHVRIDAWLELSTGHLLAQRIHDAYGRQLLVAYRYGPRSEETAAESFLPFPSDIMLRLETPAATTAASPEVRALTLTYRRLRILKKGEARFPFKVPARYDNPKR